MMRRLLAVAVVVAVGVTAPAHAVGPTIKKSIWGPVAVDGRSQFPIYADLGAGLYQHTISWAAVAPTRPLDPRNADDPAYQWPTDVDTAVTEASRYGMQVSLMLMSAPPWANGNRAPRWAPRRARDFADFAAAAARRYPSVRHWMIWGEPTKASNFQPLRSDRGRRLRGKALRGPRRYAQILDAGYGALKRVDPGNLVIGGNTFTVGTVAPLRWIRAVRLPSGRRPRMDMWGHNPFSARAPNLDAPPLRGGFADLSDLDDLARALDRAYRTAPRRQRHMKLFLSEFTLPTDHTNAEFNFYVSRARQARWLAKALRIARDYKRIYTLGYLGLYDDPLRADGEQVERGLLTRDGRRKPAYAAFRDG